MKLFSFETEEIEEQFKDLVRSTNGTEPCFDPNLSDPDAPDVLEETVTDMYAENWVSRGVMVSQARKLCEGCHVLEKCAAYAIAAKEPYGVWGGTTPLSRGIKRKYKEAA